MERASAALPILAALGLALFVLERLVPLRAPTRALLGRLGTNAAFSAMALGAATILVRPAVAASVQGVVDHSSGLVHLVALPQPLPAVLAFLLMDLSFYYWHVVNHRIPLLWRFHNVHHLDPDLDVSTALRFHFAEVGYSAAFRVAQILLIGVTPGVYLTYELVFQANTLFHHSNVRLPIRLEAALNSVLVTPRMHGIHHSQVRQETNSNYGVVFPWWDRLHRTLVLNVPQASVEIGVPGYSDPTDNRLWNALWIPFRAQRDYWLRPDRTPVVRSATAAGPDPRRLSA